ncbi:MAG: GGDEF domain-containing protein, partial [Micromonosporaceae bacterium]|nr:GGDEF domain-containing protein [Micromonosporaceae bacterium]
GIRAAANLAIGTLVMIAVLASLRINRIPDRLPWLLVLAGMVQLFIANVIWLARLSTGGSAQFGEHNVVVQETTATAVIQLGGYAALLAASVAIILRHVHRDPGGVIDAALIGIGVALPVWEFLLRPHLARLDMPWSSHAGSLAQQLALFGILGSLLHIAQASGRQATSLRYLLIALLWTIVGTLDALLSLDASGRQMTAQSDSYWGLALLSLGAGALHPSAVVLTQPAGEHSATLTMAKVAQLGVSLLLVPIIGSMPVLFGDPLDLLLLCCGPLVIVPLVLIRIGQLVSQHAQDRAQLVYQANHDELTGLPNRRQLFDRSADVIRSQSRDTAVPVAALYCDLDGFKAINDHCGHEAGDEVLRVVAERLRVCLRPADILGRVGGDEFVAICPGLDGDEVESVRQRLADTVARPIPWGDGVIQVGAAVGSAATVIPGDVWVEELITMADHDMYSRKCRSTDSRRREADAAGGRSGAAPPGGRSGVAAPGSGAATPGEGVTALKRQR